MRCLEIRNFGGLRLAEAGRPLSLARDFPRSLFSYLCNRPDRIFCRSFLAEVLWPDLDADRARAALNTALWRMRKTEAVANRLVSHSKDTVALMLGRRGWVDTVAFEARLTRLSKLRVQEQGRAYRRIGRCLASYGDDAFSDIADDWAIEERARLENLYCDALFLHAKLAYGQGDFARCATSCLRLVQFEPFREDVRELQITALTRAGNRAKAAQVFHEFAQFLERELGVAPEFTPACQTRRRAPMVRPGADLALIRQQVGAACATLHAVESDLSLLERPAEI